MKFFWSKKKYPYTQHSAPITNGILRNGKGAAATDRRRNRDDVRVTFSLRRTGSSQINLESNGTMDTVDASTYSEERPLPQRNLSILLDEKIEAKLQAFRYVKHESNSSIDATDMSDISEDRPWPRDKLSILRAAMERTELERPRASASRSKKSCPPKPKKGCSRTRRKNDDEKTEGSERRRNQQRDRKKIVSTTHARGERRRTDLTSEVGVEKPKRRLGELSADKIASSYGKWESTGTIDTADISEISEERPRPRAKLSLQLSLLLDEKIEAKMRRKAGES